MLHYDLHLSEVPLAFSGEVAAVSAVVSPPESKGDFCCKVESHLWNSRLLAACFPCADLFLCLANARSQSNS